MTNLVKFHLMSPLNRRVLAGQGRVERMLFRADGVDLGHEREGDAVFLGAKLFDHLSRSRLLAPKIIAGHPDHHKTLALVLFRTSPPALCIGG